MPEDERCRTCGARVRPSEDWCSLCLTPVNRTGGAGPESATAAGPAPGASWGPPAAGGAQPLPGGLPQAAGTPPNRTPPDQIPAPGEPVGADPVGGPAVPVGDYAPPVPTEPWDDSAGGGAADSAEQLGALLEAQHSSRSAIADLFSNPAVRWGIMLVGPLLIIGVFLGIGVLVA